MNLRGFLKEQPGDAPFLKRDRKPRKHRGARAFLKQHELAGQLPGLKAESGTGSR